MRKIIFISSLWLLSITVVYPQSGSAPACNSTIENIFKVHDLKIKYEAVQSLYRVLGIHDSTVMNKSSFLHVSKSGLNTYFEAVKGHSMDGRESPDVNSEQSTMRKGVLTEERKRDHRQLRDTISRLEPVPVVWMTDEEMGSFVEQINCTPREALIAYMKFIRGIKSERDMYVKRIDTELAKGNLSEFANEGIFYSFLEPGSPFLPPWKVTKLDFLKIFKEFILNDYIEILPDDVRVQAYLKCGCKFP